MSISPGKKKYKKTLDAFMPIWSTAAGKIDICRIAKDSPDSARRNEAGMAKGLWPKTKSKAGMNIDYPSPIAYIPGS